MADATDGKRQEAIPKGEEFMPGVGTEQLAKAFRAERVGKSKSILEACLLRRNGMNIRPIARRIRVSYATVRGWLERMKDGDLKRRFDRKHPGQKRQLDERLVRTIRRWLGNPPNLHGFRAGAWSLDMLVQSIRWRFGTTYRERTMRRILNALGYSYRKLRPVPEKSATPEEQKEFMDSTNRLVVDRMDLGYAILCGDEAACQRWSAGGYAWRARGGHDTVDVSFSRATVKMFGALGRKGHHIRVVDALNSDTFIDFLKMLQETYSKFVLVLDNASCHKSDKVNRFIESTGGDIELVFLPPYTPQLNPIEVQWRELKRLLAGQCFDSLEDLKDAIETIVEKELRPVRIMPYLTDQYKPPPPS